LPSSPLSSLRRLWSRDCLEIPFYLTNSFCLPAWCLVYQVSRHCFLPGFSSFRPPITCRRWQRSTFCVFWPCWHQIFSRGRYFIVMYARGHCLGLPYLRDAFMPTFMDWDVCALPFLFRDQFLRLPSQIGHDSSALPTFSRELLVCPDFFCTSLSPLCCSPFFFFKLFPQGPFVYRSFQFIPLSVWTVFASPSFGSLLLPPNTFVGVRLLSTSFCAPNPELVSTLFEFHPILARDSHWPSLCGILGVSFWLAWCSSPVCFHLRYLLLFESTLSPHTAQYAYTFFLVLFSISPFWAPFLIRLP